jgi:hypothetical protein
LKVLSEWQYRALSIEMGKRGYRTNEPEPRIARETSQILNKVFAALRKEGCTKADIANELHVYPQDLDALVFGLAIMPIDGDVAAPVRPRPDSYPPLELIEAARADEV